MEYMDQIKQHNNIQTMGHHQFTQFHFSKKSVQILLSISAFSLLFSCSPLLPLFSHSISTFSMQLFSYTTDWKFIFLFCNGILVFLIKNSGMAASSTPGTDTNHQHAKQNVPELAAKRAFAREQEEPGKENENFVTDGSENGVLSAEDDEFQVIKEEEGEGMDENEEEEEEEDDEKEFLIIGEEEQEGVGLLSAEELNQKCDDFIRRMREGIKIEAFMV